MAGVGSSNSNLLSPPPVREQMFINGVMQNIWVNWFNQLFKRAGGGYSPSVSDLDVIQGYDGVFAGSQASDISNLQSQVSLNAANIAINTAAIAQNTEDIQELQVLQAFDPQTY